MYTWMEVLMFVIVVRVVADVPQTTGSTGRLGLHVSVTLSSICKCCV